MRRAGALAALLAGVLATGCQSTHDKADERRAAQAAEADRLAQAEEAAKALKVVKVQGIDTKVLAILNDTEDGVAAVVVDMRNVDPKRSVVWAPIDVRLKDAKGAVIGTNNIDGADPTLIHVPSLPARGEAFYVNDQFSIDHKAASAEVVLGGDMRPLDPPPEPLETRNVELTNDPDFGASFTGTVVNTTSVPQEQLIVQALVRKDGEIIAAGTAVVDGLAPGASADFDGFFVGDPTGGEFEVIVPPSNWPGVDGAPAPEEPAASVDTTGEPAATDVATDELTGASDG